MSNASRQQSANNKKMKAIVMNYRKKIIKSFLGMGLTDQEVANTLGLTKGQVNYARKLIIKEAQ
jgi:DNA-binding CsgD family transcriptional regulator